VFGMISATLLNAHAIMREMFSITVGMFLLRMALLIFFIARLDIYGAAIAMGIATGLEQSTYVVLTLRRFSVRVADLLHSIWRPLLATTAMAAVLLGTGNGWCVVAGDTGQLVQQLVVAVSLGTVVYVGVLLAAWLAVGRPAGAETDFPGAGMAAGRHAQAALKQGELSGDLGALDSERGSIAVKLPPRGRNHSLR